MASCVVVSTITLIGLQASDNKDVINLVAFLLVKVQTTAQAISKLFGDQHEKRIKARRRV